MAGAQKYILGERIAQGGMAEIYLGKIVGSEGFTRICAIKQILPHFAEDSEFIEMFRNEAMLAKQLQNKNIVQVYDFISENGQTPMLIMEYVDGQDLRSVLRECEKKQMRLPVELALYIVAELLAGLAYAHSTVDISGKSLGIIHRDISPQNVLVSFEGDVKITDFGIAKVQSSANVTKAGVLKGKFRYMSPEQALGNTVDSRCDVFAAGIVLYELLTMTRLFKGDDDFQILQAVRDCKIRPPNEVKGTSIPTELESIVLKLLSKDPQDRPLNAREATKDLTRFLYSFRKDFFPGELADQMQKLFANRMTESRDKIRSTLALPVGTIGKNFSDKNSNQNGQESPLSLSIKSAQLSNQSITSQKNNLSGNKPPFNSPASFTLSPTGKSETHIPNIPEEAIKLEIGGIQKNKLEQQIKPTVRRHARVAPLPNYAHLQKAKSFPWEKIIIALIALLIIVGFTGLYAIKQRMLKFPTTLELRASVPNQKRVKIKVNNTTLNDGKWLDLPIQLSLEYGTHTISITKPGFTEQRLTIRTPIVGLGVFGKIRTENILLQKGDSPLCTLLIITVPKKDAKIYLDDEPMGISGKPIELLPTGKKYKLRIEGSGCSTFTGEIELPTTSADRVLTKQVLLQNCEK